MFLNKLVIVVFLILTGLTGQSQVIPSVPFAGPTGTSMVPAGWAMVDGSSDFEAIPTVPIWFGWTPDPGTLTGLPPGVNRIAHTHCLDHWGPSVIGGEAFGITVPGLTPGETYSFTTYTGGAHYSGPVTAGDVHSAMWAAPNLAGVIAMGDSPTQIGRDVAAAPNFVAETWTFTATSTSMYIVLGAESASYRTYSHTGVLWAMDDPTLVTDDPVCEDLITTVSATELCDGELLTLEATAVSGGTVTWDGGVLDGVPFAPPIGVTTYTATSDNPADCPFSVDITVYDLPTVTAAVDDVEICLGDLVMFTGGGAIDYVWDMGVTDGVAFEPLSDGTFTFTVTGTDLNGCENTAAVDLLVNPNPMIDAGPDVLVCEGEDVILSGTGVGIGGVYTWDGGITDGVAFSPAATATYTLTGITLGGCENTDEVLVTVSVTPVVNAGIDQTICEGDLVTLAGSGIGAGGVYTWDGGVVDGVPFAPASTATFTVTGANADGCENTDDVTITVVPFPTVNAGSDLTICQGDMVTLTASGAGIGGTYLWDGGVVNGVSFAPITTTTYTVTGTNGAGCENTDEVTITVNPLPNVAFNADVFAGCAPLNVNFSNLVPGGTYAWTFGDGSTSTLENPSHTYTNSGLFDVSLTVTSGAGCSTTVTYSDYINVTPTPIANFSFNPGELDIMNSSVVFDNTSLYASEFDWTFGDGSGSNISEPSHTYPENGNVNYDITLIASNEFGCADTLVKPILVKDVLLYFVPNTFTPDGDSFNEGFRPVFVSGLDVYDFHLMIFNRWGELVFESYNAAYGWQGAYGSDGLVQDGVYIWRMEFGETMSDKLHTVDGHVTVIK